MSKGDGARCRGPRADLLWPADLMYALRTPYIRSNNYVFSSKNRVVVNRGGIALGNALGRCRRTCRCATLKQYFRRRPAAFRIGSRCNRGICLLNLLSGLAVSSLETYFSSSSLASSILERADSAAACQPRFPSTSRRRRLNGQWANSQLLEPWPEKTGSTRLHCFAV